MANRNRSKQKDQSFKKDINRDVTKIDQQEAKGRKRSAKRGRNYKSSDGNYKTDKNNIAWYSRNPGLIAAVSNLPFVDWYGQPTKSNLARNTTTDERNLVRNGVPGVMTLEVMPSFGYESKPTDPINLASEKLWSYLFHTVSGQTFADAPDMMMYLLSMCEVYSYITWLKSLYGARNLYRSENAYLPKAIVTALGGNYDSIKADQLKLWGGINTLINQAASLCVPKEFTLFERRAFMFENLYSEGVSWKSQLYGFKPAGFYMFQIEQTSAAPQMVWQNRLDLWPTTPTVDELLATGTNLINALLADQDTKKLSSLVLRAYGSEGIIKLNEVPLNYETPVVQSLEVLEQIKNATVLSFSGLDSTSMIVTQDVTMNCLKYQLKTLNPNASSLTPSVASKAYNNCMALLHSKILTTSVSNPGPEIIIENSRLMLTGSTQNFSSSAAGVVTVHGASEVCVGARAYYVDKNNAIQSVVFTYINSIDMNAATVDDSAALALLTSATLFTSVLSCFKYCPAYYITYMNSKATTQVRANQSWYNMAQMPMFDVDNYATIEIDQLNDLDKVVMYELLYSETVAKAWNGQ